MIVYGSSMSPFVRKVLAYASEKGIGLESRAVGMADQDPEFRAASPFGKMPALADGDYRLADSSAIIHYLEARYPEPMLIPAEARARGRVIWFEEFADTILSACGAKMFFNRVVAPIFLKRSGDLEVANNAEREELPKLLDYLESVIPDVGFLVGETLTLADIAVASPLANLGHVDVEIDCARHPRTAAYAERILNRPSFASLVAKERAFLARARA
ncbi:glutathione S-transferase family protein [Sphingomonas sp. GCM10030256]|uniref:glutathione S-transferase family protein n=1 Tax=Sphingomonas sp. GCM10030256 TaxID=3273427 RepID=UPI00361DDD3C